MCIYIYICVCVSVYTYVCSIYEHKYVHTHHVFVIVCVCMLVIHAISLFWGKVPHCLPGLPTLGCTAWIKSIKSDAFPIWFTTGSLHETNSPNGPDVGHETVQSLVIANK